MNGFLVAGFRLHDFVSDFVTKYLFFIKRFILLVACLSLFFVFIPPVRREFGILAEATLLFLLFLSPLSKILRMRLLLQLMSLRREIGILMGCFALVHGLGYFINPISFSVIAPYLNANFFSLPPILSLGVLTLLLTLPLLLTSNNLSLRYLGGKKWKMLHRTVYAVLLLMLAHIFFFRAMGSGYSLLNFVQPVLLVFGYILLKILAWKNFIAPLRNAIWFVGKKYEEYILAKKVV